jgi:hypothetical protein
LSSRNIHGGRLRQARRHIDRRLIIGILNNGLNLMNVNSFWQTVVKGGFPPGSHDRLPEEQIQGFLRNGMVTVSGFALLRV